MSVFVKLTHVNAYEDKQVDVNCREAPTEQAPLIDSSKPPQLPQIGRQLLTSDSSLPFAHLDDRDDPARSDDRFNLVKKRTRPPSVKTNAVIGTMGSSTVKAKTGRYVAVFVSRLLPETTAEEMEAFVQDTHHMSSKCVKPDTKHQSYASFKVEVTCDNIPDMYDPEKWPVGAYVRRYYNGAAF